MIDDVQVSFPRYDLRVAGNLSRAPDLHLLFTSKFSQSRAALWLATLECSFHEGRSSSWRERGNGKSQFAECATKIGERVDEKRFTPWRPISHVAAVLFGSHLLQRKRLQRPGLSQEDSSGILQEPGRLQLYDGYRDGGRGNLGTRNRLLAVVTARDLRASCASASESWVEGIHVLTILDRRPEKYSR